ncbi:MAG TPA: hypothetical protein VIU12_16610 [Chryseolinea sp.]
MKLHLAIVIGMVISWPVCSQSTPPNIIPPSSGTTAVAKRQAVETGIVFAGDSKNEEYRFNVDGIFGETYKESRPINDYFGLGTDDTIAMKKRVREVKLFVKGKPAHLIIPEGFDRFLILTRDRTLKDGQFFVAKWSDKLPNEEANPYDQWFSRDSAVHKLPVPTVSIEFGRGFTAAALKAANYNSNSFITFSTKLLSPPALSNLQLEYEALEVKFLHHKTSLVRRLRSRGKFPASLFWPAGFKTEEGSLVVINMAYSYKQNGKVVDSGVISRSVIF